MRERASAAVWRWTYAAERCRLAAVERRAYLRAAICTLAVRVCLGLQWWLA